MSLPSWSLRHPVSTVMAMVSVILFGAISINLIPVEFFPDTDSPHMRVSIIYRSSAPDEVRRRITLPVEEVLSTLPRLTQISSTSSANSANFSMTFELKTDMDMMGMEVRDRLDHVHHRLPEGVDRVRIHRWRSSERPVIEAFLAFEGPRQTLMMLAEDVVQPRLLRLRGVADVDVRGVKRKQFLVALDRERLASRNIDVREVTSAIRQNNHTSSGGVMRAAGQSSVVRVVGELDGPKALGDLTVGSRGVKLSDLGEISFEEPPIDRVDEMDGIPALTVQIQKASNANLVAVARRSRETLKKLADEIDGLTFHVYRDRSESILQRVGSLRQAAIIGGSLAVLFIFLFLRHLPSTLVVGLTIPLSAVATFGGMYLLRRTTDVAVTINIISLMGLLIAVGMLVDPAVVVLENIFRKRHDEGISPGEAARLGAGDVSVALSAATLTSLCVFLPMIFMPTTRMGMFMRDFAVVICSALVSALLVSLTLVPLLSKWVMTKPPARKSRMVVALEKGYVRLAGLTIRSRWHAAGAVGVAIALLVGSVTLMQQIEKGRTRYIRPRQAEVRMEFDNAFTLADVNSISHRIYDLLDARRDSLEIETLVIRADRRSANITAYLRDDGLERLATDQVKARIDALMPTVPGATMRMRNSRGMGGGTSGVNIELRGRDLKVLSMLAQIVQERVETLSEVSKVDNSLENGTEEMVVRRRPEQGGDGEDISPNTVSSALSAALSEHAITYMTLDEREIDISLRVGAGARSLTTHSVRSLPLAAEEGAPVPLESLVSFGYQEGPRPIRREDRLSTVVVSVEGAIGITEPSLTSAVETVMERVQLPPGYSWRHAVEHRRWRRSRQLEIESLGLAIILVYMVMAALFESFVYPLAILFSIPFALTGAAITLYLTKQPQDPMIMLGLIMLAGIVVNNAIILVDHINHLRKNGLARNEAILEGGRHRLRPILMTALTTVFGLLPMASSLLWATIMRWGDWLTGLWGGSVPGGLRYLIPPVEGGAAFWAPMGLVLMGGLAASTVLTLVLIPAIYMVLDDVTAFASRVSKAMRKSAPSTQRVDAHT